MDTIDFTKESNEILAEVSKNFGQDSQELIYDKIIETRKKVNDLLKQLEGAQFDEKKSHRRRNLTKNMKEAYRLIMQIRTDFLGEGEKISYRLYLRGEDINKVKIVDINEETLLKLVERSGNELRLRRTFKNIESIESNSRTQELFNQHFQSISRSLKPVEHGYVVPFSKVRDVVKTRVGSSLYWQKDSTSGKSAYTPKIWNRGWIYQAFDATINSLYNENSNIVIEESEFRFTYFNKHLVYDNVVGFKGGDVGVTQIKSNMASLVNITTLIKYLKIIQDILNFNNFSNEQALVEYIKKNFTNKENLTDELNIIIEKRANALLNIIKKFDNIKIF